METPAPGAEARAFLGHEHGQAQAGEYLRLALGLMARLGLGPTPLSYAVCYEYACGQSTGLRQAVDTLLAEGAAPDQEAMRNLFLQHIYDCTGEYTRRMQGELRRAMSEAVSYTDQASSSASQATQMLEGYSSQLEDPLNVDQVRAVAREIIAETRAVGDASRRLQVQLVATSDELEDLRRELDHLRLEANTDMLTRVLNRRGFDRALAAAVANAAEGAPCCLLLVDVDRFKEVNDTYGHLLGDKVLRLIAELMLRAVKGRDVVARLGGDEFAVILPETALAGAKAVAESIRRAVEKSRVTRRDTGAVVADVTVSIGVVAYQAGAAPDAFLHRADEALYQAKGAGRNRVTLLV